MDGDQERSPARVQASPAPLQAGALVGLAVVLAVLGLTSDVGGAVLALPAAAVALGLGVRDLVLRPVLQADARGLDVVQGLRRRHVAWSQVVRLRVVTDRRAVLLEVELPSDEVLLLSRGRLGRDPRDVLEELLRLRP